MSFLLSSLKMAAISTVLLNVNRCRVLHHCFAAIPVQLTSSRLPRGLCSVTSRNTQPNLAASTDSETLLKTSKTVHENQSLLLNLNNLGVDVDQVRQRQPGVLRKALTNEMGFVQFMKGKGASLEVIAAIICRYPRAITRSVEHLNERWAIWRIVFHSDEEIVSLLNRSPEAFFRTSDNDNLKSNMAFLTSLGLDLKHLHRLFCAAPRTFSNTLALNRQTLQCLESICVQLGGTDPRQFAKTVLSRNNYIFIQSTKRILTNVDHMKVSIDLNDSELLEFLQGPGAVILNLAKMYIKNNVQSLRQKMISFGCQNTDVKRLIVAYPLVLYAGSKTLSSKLDCFIKSGITIEQILDEPSVMEFSIQTIADRLEVLKRMNYDFKKNGITILTYSQKRFVSKTEKLAALIND